MSIEMHLENVIVTFEIACTTDGSNIRFEAQPTQLR